jgi:hypothetical protein
VLHICLLTVSFTVSRETGIVAATGKVHLLYESKYVTYYVVNLMEEEFCGSTFMFTSKIGIPDVC